MTDSSRRLLTLGRLALVDAAGVEDRSLGTRRRKLALLALLAISRRPVSRDMLVEMFWGDQPEDRARHSLSDALSHLRRALGPDSITTRRAEVQLVENGSTTVDVHQFFDYVEAGRLPDAIALYRGPFLDAVHIGGSASWEQWVGQQRARFGALFQDACKRECKRLAASRDWQRCGAIAERWLKEEPLSPHAALHLLASLAAADSPEEDLRAMAVYDRLVRRLHVEYDCTPDSRVTLAAHEIGERIRDARAVNAFVNTAPPPVVQLKDPVNAEGGRMPVASRSVIEPEMRQSRWTPRAFAGIAAGALLAVALATWRTGPLAALTGFESSTAAAVTTASPQARDQYERALGELSAGGDRDKAVEFLERAVAIDTTFVTAHRRLAQLLNGDETSHARVVELLSRAARHAHRAGNNERQLLLGDYHLYVTRDYARAASALRSVLTVETGNSAAWHRLGMVYQYVGDNQRAAEAYRESVELKPDGAAGWGNLIDALYASGDASAAQRALDDMERALPGHPAVFWQTASLAAAIGNYSNAEKQARAYLAATRTDLREQAIGQRLLARIHWSAGNFESGDRAQHAAIDLEEQRGDPASALRERLVLSIAPVWQGRRKRADTRAVEAALAAHPVEDIPVADRPYAELTIARALSGDIVRARQAIDEWSSHATPVRREQDSSLYQVARGTIAIAEGKYEDAIRELEQATTSMCPLCGMPELGLANEALGRADSAARVYRRYMDTPTLWRVDLLDALHRRWISSRISNGGSKDVVTSESLRADRR